MRRTVPVSAMQGFYWLVYETSQTQPPPFHGRRAIYCVGALDVDQLRRAIELLCVSHEALSTRFSSVERKLCQTFGGPAPELVVTDLKGLPPEERIPAARSILDDCYSRRFALAEGESPLRLHLIELSAGEAVLALTIHHIVVDFRSAQIIGRDLAMLYERCVAGDAQPLERPRFSDIVLEDSKMTSGPEYEKKLAFWREHLAGASLVVAGRSSPNVSELCVRFEFPLDELVASDAKRLGVGRAGVLLSRFERAIRTWAVDMDDITAGFFIANRSGENRDEVVGCLAQWLPVRLRRSSPQETDDEGVRRCDEAFGRARKNALPVGDIVAATKRRRLFDVVLTSLLLPGLHQPTDRTISRGEELSQMLTPRARPLFSSRRIGDLEWHDALLGMTWAPSTFAMQVLPHEIVCRYSPDALSSEAAEQSVRVFAAAARTA
jgi:hypothetical protein